MNRKVVAAIALALLALLVRLSLLKDAGIIETDGVLYVRNAQGMEDGRGVTADDGYRHDVVRILYPALIAACHTRGMDWELSGRLASVAAGTALVVVVYFLGALLFGGGVGLLAGVLVALAPEIALTSTSIMTETTYSLSVCAALLAIVAASRNAWPGLTVTAGALSCLPYLTRPEGILFLILSIPLAAWFPPSTVERSRRVTTCCLHIFGVVVVLVPYILLLHGIYGRLTLSPEVDRFDWGGLHSYLGTLYYDAYMKQIPTLLALVPTMLFGIGLLRSVFADRRFRDNAGLISVAALMIFVYPCNPNSAASVRHYIPVLPILYLWVANGILEPARWQTIGLPGRSKAGVLVACALTILLLAGFAPRLSARHRMKHNWDVVAFEQKQAGLWIRQHLGPGQVIMTRSPEVAFYADGLFVRIPRNAHSWSNLSACAITTRVTCLVADTRWTVRDYPWMTPLLDTRDLPPGIEVAHTLRTHPKYTVTIYRTTRELQEQTGQ